MIKHIFYLSLATITLNTSFFTQATDINKGVVLNYSDINFYKKTQKYLQEKNLEQTINQIKNKVFTTIRHDQSRQEHQKWLHQTVEQLDSLIKAIDDFLKINLKLKKEESEQLQDFSKLVHKTKNLCNSILTDKSFNKKLKNSSLEAYNTRIKKCNNNIQEIKKMLTKICLNITMMVSHYELMSHTV